VLHQKKAAQSHAAIDTDQDASVHPIDPTDLAKKGAAATLLPTAQRVSGAPTETAVVVKNEVATGEAVIESANETVNQGQDGSPVKAADESVVLVMMDELREGTNAIGGAVVAEAVEEQTMAAREVAIPRIKAMEKQRGGVSGAERAFNVLRFDVKEGSKPTLHRQQHQQQQQQQQYLNFFSLLL
jgi:hypothetical protein